MGTTDSTIAYANSNDLYIEIERVQGTLIQQHVRFKAAITQFSDLVTANWKTEEVFGRMDPIATYQNTQRKISIGWEVIAFDYDEAYENLRRVSSLQKFLYPLFETTSATSMADAPLLRLKMSNLIQGTSGYSGQALLGFVNGGFNFTPDIDMGFFHRADMGVTRGVHGVHTRDIPDDVTKQMVPKKFSLSCDFTVLHEEKLGWELTNYHNSDVLDDNTVYAWRGEATFPSLPEGGSPKKQRREWETIQEDKKWAEFDAQVQKDWEEDERARKKELAEVEAVQKKIEQEILDTEFGASPDRGGFSPNAPDNF